MTVAPATAPSHAPLSDRAAEIAIITVNYGTADLTIAGTRSVLEREHGGRTVVMHLVENASPGDDAAQLNAAFDNAEHAGRVVLHIEAENHGFGRGNNVALKALAQLPTPPRYVMLLNPDAALENEAVDLLAACLDEHPQVAAVGAGIALPDGTPVTAAFRFPTPVSEFTRLTAFGPISRLLKNREVALPPDHPEGPVDWVAGAAVMMRLDVAQAMEFFDPAFFLYYEEVDLMRRIRSAGHEVWYLPKARVVHAEGAATDVKSHRSERRRSPGYLYDSWRIYFRKTYGRGGAAGIAGLTLLGATLNFATRVLRGRAPTYPRSFIRDQFRLVFLPLLTGREPRT